jgi:LemA protein
VASWIVIGGPILLALAAICSYNNLLTLRHRVQDAWTPVEAQLRSRGDRVQDLVEAMNRTAASEPEALRAVVTAFRQAREAETVPARAEAENELSEALRCLFATVPAYREPDVSPGIRALREALTAAEEQIASARRYYNRQVMAWNVRIARFPWSLISRPAGLHPAEYFVMDEPSRLEAPPVAS